LFPRFTSSPELRPASVAAPTRRGLRDVFPATRNLKTGSQTETRGAERGRLVRNAREAGPLQSARALGLEYVCTPFSVQTSEKVCVLHIERLSGIMHGQETARVKRERGNVALVGEGMRLAGAETAAWMLSRDARDEATVSRFSNSETRRQPTACLNVLATDVRSIFAGIAISSTLAGRRR
jgi:hypothetical protein